MGRTPLTYGRPEAQGDLVGVFGAATSPSHERSGQAAEERLRQERETFDQKKAQDASWFKLRIAIGWSAAVALPAICLLAGYVIVRHEAFDPMTVKLATTALLADALGLILAVFRLVLGRGPEELAPVTHREEHAQQT